jgi:hypothetical protein
MLSDIAAPIGTGVLNILFISAVILSRGPQDRRARQCLNARGLPESSIGFPIGRAFAATAFRVRGGPKCLVAPLELRAPGRGLGPGRSRGRFGRGSRGGRRHRSAALSGHLLAAMGRAVWRRGMATHVLIDSSIARAPPADLRPLQWRWPQTRSGAERAPVTGDCHARSKATRPVRRTEINLPEYRQALLRLRG